MGAARRIHCLGANDGAHLPDNGWNALVCGNGHRRIWVPKRRQRSRHGARLACGRFCRGQCVRRDGVDVHGQACLAEGTSSRRGIGPSAKKEPPTSNILRTVSLGSAHSPSPWRWRMPTARRLQLKPRCEQPQLGRFEHAGGTRRQLQPMPNRGRCRLGIRRWFRRIGPHPRMSLSATRSMAPLLRCW